MMRDLVKRILCSFFLVAAFVLSAQAQQDAQFSQYIFNGLYINPGYAGYKQDLYLNTFYRSQWSGIDGAPRTFSFSADGAVNDAKVGLGVLVTKDNVGAQSNMSAYANYAYRLQVGESDNSRLSFGIGAGFVQSGLDGSVLSGVDATDNYIPTTYQSIISPDARAGILLTTDVFFAGISADNMIAHMISKSKSATVAAPVPVPHIYFTAGGLINLNEDVKFKPSILVRNDQGGPTTLDINAFMLLGERVWIGGTYRSAIAVHQQDGTQSSFNQSNAFVGMIELFATEKLRIGYALDYSLTPLRSYGGGSHELSVGMSFGQTSQRRNAPKCYF